MNRAMIKVAGLLCASLMLGGCANTLQPLDYHADQAYVPVTLGMGPAYTRIDEQHQRETVSVLKKTGAFSMLDGGFTRNGYSQYRQVTAIDHLGRSVHFSGSQTLGTHHAVSGEQCVAAGNMLADREVITAMVSAFEQGEGQLADRLLAAMHAAIAAGGEADAGGDPEL